MSEVRRECGYYQAQWVTLQGLGHGPVWVKTPGLNAAYCEQCAWVGPTRFGFGQKRDEAMEADGQLHLDQVAADEVSPGRLAEALDEAYGRGRDDEANGVPTESRRPNG